MGKPMTTDELIRALEDDGGPRWASERIAELQSRNFERVNDPRKKRRAADPEEGAHG